jgi:putative ABC transport system permease protein
MIYVFLLAVSCILGGVGALGLVTTVSLNVTERRREMGVLRAIGATPGRVAQIVIIEGMVAGAMAWVVAMATVVPLSRAIGNLMLRLLLQIQTEITFAIEPSGVVIWLVVALAPAR